MHYFPQHRANTLLMVTNSQPFLGCSIGEKSCLIHVCEDMWPLKPLKDSSAWRTKRQDTKEHAAPTQCFTFCCHHHHQANPLTQTWEINSTQTRKLVIFHWTNFNCLRGFQVQWQTLHLKQKIVLLHFFLSYQWLGFFRSEVPALAWQIPSAGRCLEPAD